MLIFENNAAFYYPFGYEHYLERKEKEASGEPLAARIKAEEQALIEGLKLCQGQNVTGCGRSRRKKLMTSGDCGWQQRR